MIDVHSHILPGIDDGAKDVKEAIELLKRLQNQGVSSVVATPHFYPDIQKLDGFLEGREKAFQILNDAAAFAWVTDGEEPTDVTAAAAVAAPVATAAPALILGSETLISDTLFAYESLEPLCFAGTEYLLLELPYSREWGGSVFRAVDKLMSRFGITPIIAHVERYEAVQHKPEKYLNELVELGCLLQMNLDSLIERRSKRYALKLIKNDYIDLIGSDCHNMTSRPPRFSEFRELAEKNHLGNYLGHWTKNAEKLLKNNPSAVR